jgi:lipopolysaccharide/colanic/teichoic acid biosynthesis glycosyltransferase
MQTGARHVILAFSSERDHRLVEIVNLCRELGVEVLVVPRLYESVNGRASLDFIGGLPLFSLGAIDPKGWQFACKHVMDRVLALLGLIALAPVLAAIALVVKLSSPGPVIFRQRRVGRDGRDFDVLKFRTMRQMTDALGFMPPPGVAPGGVEGVDRRTSVGKWLRSTSLDELPQLFNVLKGEMSIVGPRPERPEYAEQFSRVVHGYTYRHRVKSGITGWAQVNGLRGQTSIDDRVEWDNHYIENWTPMLDLRTIVLTVAEVLRCRGDSPRRARAEAAEAAMTNGAIPSGSNGAMAASSNGARADIAADGSTHAELSPDEVPVASDGAIAEAGSNGSAPALQVLNGSGNGHSSSDEPSPDPPSNGSSGPATPAPSNGGSAPPRKAPVGVPAPAQASANGHGGDGRGADARPESELGESTRSETHRPGDPGPAESEQKAPLELIAGAEPEEVVATWFCGYCGASPPGGSAPPPVARVCGDCGQGLMLETRSDAAPRPGEAFLVVDNRLTVQALSKDAESLLGVAEQEATDRPVSDLLVGADAERGDQHTLVELLDRSVSAVDEPLCTFIRPRDTYGVRLRVRISACGPPRGCLIVFESDSPPAPRPTRLRLVPGEVQAEASTG